MNASCVVVSLFCGHKTLRMSARVQLLFLLPAVALLACNRPKWDTPTDAYMSFARAIKKQDSRTAWSGLSTESKQALEARAKAISESTGGAVRPAPQPLFFGGGFEAPPVRSVKLLSQEGKEARLAVVSEGGAEKEVRMVREEEGWRLDVTDMLGEMGGSLEQ